MIRGQTDTLISSARHIDVLRKTARRKVTHDTDGNTWIDKYIILPTTAYNKNEYLFRRIYESIHIDHINSFLGACTQKDFNEDQYEEDIAEINELREKERQAAMADNVDSLMAIRTDDLLPSLPTNNYSSLYG